VTGIAEDSLALEVAVDAAIEACGGDPRSAVRALIAANNYLEAEAKRLAELSRLASLAETPREERSR
jgi:hypothetical protein